MYALSKLVKTGLLRQYRKDAKKNQKFHIGLKCLKYEERIEEMCTKMLHQTKV